MQNQNMNLVLSTDAKPRLKWTPEASSAVRRGCQPARRGRQGHTKEFDEDDGNSWTHFVPPKEPPPTRLTPHFPKPRQPQVRQQQRQIKPPSLTHRPRTDGKRGFIEGTTSRLNSSSPKSSPSSSNKDDSSSSSASSPTSSSKLLSPHLPASSSSKLLISFCPSVKHRHQQLLLAPGPPSLSLPLNGSSGSPSSFVISRARTGFSPTNPGLHSTVYKEKKIYIYHGAV
ncbi:hypothetical protein PS2_006654 [Malus domestica]